MTEEVLIAARALMVGYDPGRPVVFDVELTASAGDIIAIVGPNGCGKSTVLKSLAGQLRPSTGTISVARTPMKVFRPDVFRRAGVAYAPQSEACFGTLTVEENLRVAAYQLTGRREASRWVRHMLTRFPELESMRSRTGAALSGGEKKVLAFAMTLVPHARVLILDEPAAGLSAQWRNGLADRVVRAAEVGLAVIFAEQDLAFASRVAHRVCVMREGRVVEVLPRDGFVAFLKRSETVQGFRYDEASGLRREEHE